MGKLTKSVAVFGGFVIGIVTLRALRNRGTEDEPPEEELEEEFEEELEAAEAEIEHVEDELETATEHATAAIEHAGIAAKKTLEARRQRVE